MVAGQEVTWGPGRKEAVIEEIDYELQFALGTRQALMAQFQQWLEDYRAPAKQPVKTFPFEGASNYILPVTAIDVDQLFAKFLQTIHAPSNLWSISPYNEKWLKAAKPLQDFLEWLDGAVLKMYNVDKRVLMDMTKLGTGIYKHGWNFEAKTTHRYTPTGQVERIVARRGVPFVDHVKLDNFILPTSATAHQADQQGGAKWIAERIRVHPDTLRWMAKSVSPLLPALKDADVEFVIDFEERSQTQHDAKVHDLDYVHKGVAPKNVDPAITDAPGEARSALGGAPILREIELFEVHARYATRGGAQDDIILLYHQPTRTILRAVYNYYLHGQRPYEVVRYFPSEGFWGIGVCEQKEMFQRVQSELMNLQLDNVLLANSRMIAVKQGASLMPGDPVFPGRVIVTEGDPRAEMASFQMGDIYSSLPNTFSQFNELGRVRTGVGDLQMGNLEGLPGRTPATSILTLLQEGNRRPDLTLKDIRYEGLSTIGMRLIQYLQQFGASPVDVGGGTAMRVMQDVLGMPEGVFAKEALQMPMTDPATGLTVNITATSGGSNKEVDRQQSLAMFQLAMQAAPQFIQLAATAQQAQGTPVGAVAQMASNGLAELFRRVLEKHDERDIEAILPAVPPAQPAQPPAPGAVPLPGPNGGAGAPAGNPGLAGAGVGLGTPLG